MSRNTNTTIQNNFIGGFVTQATALDFPQNAAFEADNVVFSEIGIATRRFGLDYENNFEQLTSDRTEAAQSTFYWKNADGIGGTNLVIQQNGSTLFFYDTSNSLSLSRGISANTVSLTSFQSSGSTTSNLVQNECEYATGLGYLFVVHPYCDPFYVLYNPSNGTFTASTINFTIRDLTGLTESGVLVTNRPTTLTANHTYNLLNQGWTQPSTGAGSYTIFHTAASAYPSNADVWWLFKDSTDVYNPSAMLASVLTGSTYAAQGFFTQSPWNTARAATALAQGGATLTLTGSNIDQTSGTIRPSAVEFHEGRVWYAGVNAQGYNSYIYFSTIVNGPVDFGSCMTQADPTSQYFAFVPSDGGIVAIPQAGTIYKMISLGATLIVFGENGVWSITGSVGTGFSATDYSVQNIAYVRNISGTSYVIVDGNIMWWNQTGIQVMTNDPTRGLQIESLSDKKIKDYFLSLDNTAKSFARGAYNQREHVVYWLYRSEPSGGLTDIYTYDTVIAYNTLIDAWYTWNIETTPVSLNSIVVVEGAGSLTGSNPINDNAGDTLLDNNGDTLVTYGFVQTTVQTTTKFLCSTPGSGSYLFTFAEQFNPTYMDWQQNNTPVDYVSTFTTGYSVKTQGIRNFQSNYIYIFTDLSVGFSSYTFQSLWNYGNTGNSGQWQQRQTIGQTVVHQETAYDASRRRLKVRGAGTAVQFKFTSVSGLPFAIIGWATADSANAKP